MRSLLFAGLMCAVFAGTALAQYGGMTPGGPTGGPQGSGAGGSGGGGHNGGGSGGGHGGAGGHDANTPPPPPPIPRCPDLAVATYAYLTSIPGGAPLATDEVGIQFEVRNAGTAAYPATMNGQSLILSYNTPGGAHQVASIALPPTSGSTPAAAQSSQLAPQQSWVGVMRAVLTPADRRWPLHLKIQYGNDPRGIRTFANDCNTDNNEIVLVRP